MTIRTLQFGIVDYVVFVVMLIASTSVGIYFGFFAKSKNTTDEYLMGGRKMKTVPIAISLVASQLSSIAIMSIPAETYSFGFLYIFVAISMLAMAPLLMYIITPVFYENNYSNCYQYLQKRFNKASRQLVTAAFILNSLLILPILMFVPSLAFSQVTGFNTHIINIAVCSICILYTMLGGIKAVVWTDVIQGGIMLTSVIVVGIMGTFGVGGLRKVLEHAANGGRLDPNISLDPRTRITIWNAFLSGSMFWIGHIGFSQSCLQRILSLPTLRNAQWSILLTAIGVFLIMGFNCYIGIVMYAYYYDCDPVSVGLVEKADKMMPFFVQNIVGQYNGMPGVFISCVFSASLSTLSATFNSVAGIIYFDYIKPFVKHSEEKANFIMKIIVTAAGCYCIVGGFVVQHFNSILQMVITFTGVNFGAVVGLFLLGMFVPRVNGKAALLSFILTLLGMTWLIINAQIRLKNGTLKYTPLEMRTDGCDARYLDVHEFNLTSTKSTVPTDFDAAKSFEDRKFSIYDISFCWYKVSGLVLTGTLALIFSFIWKNDESDQRDEKLYSHLIRKFVVNKQMIDMKEIEPLKIQT